eukprot:COSAG05_NODE_1116_length_5825_cov_11.050304_3_plen_37_part_00
MAVALKYVVWLIGGLAFGKALRVLRADEYWGAEWQP